MSEVIVKMINDHIKVKGGEYVRDLVRCKDCRWWIENLKVDDTDETYLACRWDWHKDNPKPDDFCSWGEVRDE